MSRPRRARLFAFLLALAPIAGLAGVEVPQADGGTLSLPAPATRIVALAPNIAEALFAAGAGDLLLATAEYSNHPPEAAALPRIGDAFRFDLERILAWKPDLVIGWQSGNPANALDGLTALGLPVWRTEIASPDEIAVLLERIGLLTGREAPAAAAAAAFRERLAALRAANAGKPVVHYFYQVAERPLYTVNGRHLISQAIDTCGARNVFDTLPNLAPQVAIEAVLALDPQVLFAPAIPGQDDPLAQWRAWPRLTAVRNGALLTLPADPISRATPRLLDAIDEACTLLDAVRATEGSPATEESR